jgi:MFS family permease
MLTACGFILVFGRVYTFANTKECIGRLDSNYSILILSQWVFLSGIALFEIGSALCGAAPNSIALILGRAIAGLGSSGIFTGAISKFYPLRLWSSIPRIRYQGRQGLTFDMLLPDKAPLLSYLPFMDYILRIDYTFWKT